VISKPILFSGPMVRAILEGRKTQTRRVVKPQPVGGDRIVYDTFNEEFVVGRMRDSENAWTKLRPRFEVGSEMWVRETWNGTQGEGVAYRATEPQMDGEPWRPSIFMPRWASRLTLTVKDVRVERLQDISEADAIAEGVSWPDGAQDQNVRKWGVPQTARMAYADLWESINGTGSWDANPWVWVYVFEVKQ